MLTPLLRRARNLANLTASICPFPRLRMRLYRFGGNRMGEQVYLNMLVRTIIDPAAGVTVILGDRVAVAPGVVFAAVSDPTDSRLSAVFPKQAKSIEVDDDAWIGANAVIFPGVKIGKMAVVAAGAVVREDVPPGVIVAGVPARELGSIEEKTGELPHLE